MARAEDNAGSEATVSARRRRPTLVVIAAASAALGLLGLAGIFAAATDRGTTGENRYRSADVPEGSVFDLLIAERQEDGSCGPFTNDLTTALFDFESEATGSDVFARGVCMRNGGQIDGDVSFRVLDLDSREVACTNREAEEDGTCAPGEAGELEGVTHIAYTRCTDPEVERAPLSYESLQGTVDRSAWLLRLPAGATEVVCIDARVVGNNGRAAQSDRLTWRYAFDLTDWEAGPVLCGEAQLDPEPNDDIAQAVELAAFDEQPGTLCRGVTLSDPSDTDVYQVNHPSSGAFEVIFTMADDSVNPYMELRLDDGSVVVPEAEWVAPGVRRIRADSGSGTYYVRLAVDLGYSVNQYTIEYRPLA